MLRVSRHKANCPIGGIGDFVREPQGVMAGIQTGVCVHPTSDGELRSRMNFERIVIKNRKVPRRQLLF